MKATSSTTSIERPEGSSLSPFREAFGAYYAAMKDLARHLMRLMALALDLDETWFDHKVEHHITNLTVNHYPELERPPLPGQLRRCAHSDWGSLTILHHDGQPGLQVQRGDTWTDVPMVPDSFVVNLGDLMARWTNDRWVSTMHRVVVPPDEHGDRLSVAFFHQPTYDAVIECIPTCASPDHPPKYPIGAALFDGHGQPLGVGHNGSVQHGDFLAHAETTAVRAAGKLADYTDTVLVTTMTPCWYCAGLVRFLGIGTVVVGDTRTWSPDSLDWLESAGVHVVRADDHRCHQLFADWLTTNPDSWALPTNVNGWPAP